MAKWGTAAVLVVLIGANVVWIATTGVLWPLLGVAVYGVMVVLVVRSGDYRAACAAAVLGFALHLRMLLPGSASADRSDLVLLIVNTVLPAAVFVLALQAWRTRRAE